MNTHANSRHWTGKLPDMNASIVSRVQSAALKVHIYTRLRAGSLQRLPPPAHDWRATRGPPKCRRLSPDIEQIGAAHIWHTRKTHAHTARFDKHACVCVAYAHHLRRQRVCVCVESGGGALHKPRRRRARAQKGFNIYVAHSTTPASYIIMCVIFQFCSWRPRRRRRSLERGVRARNAAPTQNLHKYLAELLLLTLYVVHVWWWCADGCRGACMCIQRLTPHVLAHNFIARPAARAHITKLLGNEPSFGSCPPVVL